MDRRLEEAENRAPQVGKMDTNEVSRRRVPRWAWPAGIAALFLLVAAGITVAIIWAQLLRPKPEEAVIHLNRGNLSYDQGDLETALAEYDRAIQIKPDYAEAYFGRGNVYYDQGDLARALAEYDRAIQLDPDYADAYFARGIAYGDQDDPALAIADFDQEVQLLRL